MQPSRISLILLLTVMLTGCQLFKSASKAPARDTQAEYTFSEGQRALQAENYDLAADAFERTLLRPENRVTTAALYLAGMAYYHLEWYELAEQRFDRLKNRYPKSKYVGEAQYHQALIKLESRKDSLKAEGVGVLLSLAEISKNESLTVDALKAAREALFKRGTEQFPGKCAVLAPASQRGVVYEAWCYREIVAGRYPHALELYNDFKKKGGIPTPFLLSLFPTNLTPTQTTKPNAPARIAVFLPMMLDELRYSTEVPESSMIGLDFYEGFRLALESKALYGRRPVFVRIIDSKKDSLLTPRIIQSLDSLKPQVVVGGIYNGLSRSLANWAETRNVTQVVPISSNPDLVENKNQVFLAHPSTATHGTRMARYAAEVAHLRKVVVFTDGQPATEQMTQAFIQAFTRKGGVATRVFFNFTDNNKNIQSIRAALVSGVDGVYLPYLNNEESANLVLTQLYDKKVTVMGSPHFRTRYHTIDRTLLERLEMVCSTSHFINELSGPYLSFERSYSERYGGYPSEQAIQGYDLGNYLAGQLENFDPGIGLPFSAYIRNASLVQGLHLSYLFQGEQSNQFVNLIRFTREGIQPVYLVD